MGVALCCLETQIVMHLKKSNRSGRFYSFKELLGFSQSSFQRDIYSCKHLCEKKRYEMHKLNFQ